jgi:hypothetical protein
MRSFVQVAASYTLGSFLPFAAIPTNFRFVLLFQQVAATQASNFSAGV